MSEIIQLIRESGTYAALISGGSSAPALVDGQLGFATDRNNRLVLRSGSSYFQAAQINGVGTAEAVPFLDAQLQLNFDAGNFDYSGVNHRLNVANIQLTTALMHVGDEDTKLVFGANTIDLYAGGVDTLSIVAGYVGIGVAAASPYALHIKNISYPWDLLLLDSGTDMARIGLSGGAGTQNLQIIPGVGGTIFRNSGGTADKIWLTSSGSIGVGTNPTNLLDVYNATGDSVIGTRSNLSTGLSMLELKNNQAYVAQLFLNGSGQGIYGGNNSVNFFTNGPGPYTWYNNSTELMRLSSAGLLGLGVTPTAQIDSLAAGAAPYLHNRLVGLAHGMTALAETNVFLKIAVADTTHGGAGISAYTGSDITALVISAVVGVTTTTHPAFLLLGAKKAAAGPAWQVLTATEVHSRWDNLTNPLMTLYGNGNLSNIGTLTIGSIADGTGNFLTNGGSGLVKSRTAAETLGDIGAMPSTTTSFNTNGAYNITKTTILADDAEAVLDTVLGLGGAMSHVNGYAMISLVGGAGWSGLFQVNDGTIAVSALSANAAANDTDGSICLFWDGSSRVIKNRSGGSHTFSVIFFGAITA